VYPKEKNKMATRTLKPDTQIRRQIEAFVASSGLRETDVSLLADRTRVILMPPNRFGQGYIRMITPTMVWEADLSRKDPAKVTTPKSRPAVG